MKTIYTTQVFDDWFAGLRTTIRHFLIFFARFSPSMALDPGIHAGMTGSVERKSIGLNYAFPVIPPGIGGIQRHGWQ